MTREVPSQERHSLVYQPSLLGEGLHFFCTRSHRPRKCLDAEQKTFWVNACGVIYVEASSEEEAFDIAHECAGTLDVVPEAAVDGGDEADSGEMPVEEDGGILY